MNHEVKFPREYREEIRKFETSDYGNAEVLNQPLNILVNNDVYIKEQLETVRQGLQNHEKTTAVHVTEAQKNAWTKKAETTAATASANGLMTAADKAKLNGIAAGAEVNQNAFQTVRAGGVNVQASGKTAQVELVAGNNLTITGDNGTKKITITGPNAVKNPAALAVQLNGSAAVSYDGSAAKTVNITPAGIGAAAAGHIHDDRYYTEAETNNLLNGKANNSHTHTAAQVSGLPSVLPANGGTAARIFNGANINDTAIQFNWNGQNGQPNWLWGGNDGKNMYVYNPAVFRVDYANSAGSANSVSWGNVSGKPSTFPPTSHTHDERYYTEAETNNLLNGKANNNAAIFTGSISMGRKSGTTVGTSSSAFGRDVEASGPYTYAGGYLSVALKDGAHAEGCGTTANGVGAHAEGYNNNAVGAGNVAYGRGSHVEGVNTIAGTAEGVDTFMAAHAEGYNTTASGAFSHSQGSETTASGIYSHSQGNETIASGDCSHAEGSFTAASGASAHAQGVRTVARGFASHAGGDYTIASGWCHTVIGRYNADTTENNVFFSPFIIGGGSADNTRLNIFRVHYSGAVYAKGTYSTGGADYAEYFEWMDQNKEREDRVGYFVTLDGDKIKIANPGDYILGIVSATPSVIGNSYEDQWQGRDTKDVWGRTIYERTEHKQEDGTVLIADEPIITQDYNTKTVYIPRSKRPEWSPVGMLGVLAVREDGTCQVNGYCQVADGGIATAADGTEEYALVNGQITKRYRVIERITDNIVKIVFR